ncbi:MAG: extracellular solute-binding protein [Clostridia bacterium]
MKASWIRRVSLAFVIVLLLGLSAAEAAPITLQIMANAVKGGKNTQDAEWIEKMIPEFEKDMKAQGQDIRVEFVPSGINDEDYKARLALDIKGGGGPDVIAFDHFWVPEFAEANFLLPLDSYLKTWPDWNQYFDTMKAMGAYQGKTYLVMSGTDVRMIYYNKELFKKAGIPVPWQPKNWEELLQACRTIKQKLPGVTPIQLNAGVEMGEATSMQGFYMALCAAGGWIYNWDTGKWIVKSPELLEALKLYRTIYVDEKLGDAMLQVSPKAREKSFALFSTEKIAMYVEGTWMWSSVISPNGAWAIPDRDTRIGWAAFPGSGKPGAPPFASVSGGTGWVVNPNTKHPDLAFKLLAKLNSAQARVAYWKVKPGIPARKDLADMPEVKADVFISETTKKLVPYTTYRPGQPAYPQVSYQVQLMTERVVTGQMTPEQALDAYAKAVTELAGEAKVEIQK